MKIILNGEEKHLDKPLNIEELLIETGYSSKKVAVALNRTFVPKGQHANTTVNDNDEIDIVAPMQGG